MADTDMIDCPFCGSDEITVEQAKKGWHSAFCGNCEAEGPPSYSNKDARLAWNGRPALASRPAEVDDEGQSDAKRLMFVMQDIDGFGSVKQDKYDLAVVVMEERGLDEPDWECELEGVRRLIDMAMVAPSHTTNKEK